jgi:hypothetical protein
MLRRLPPARLLIAYGLLLIGYFDPPDLRGPPDIRNKQ